MKNVTYGIIRFKSSKIITLAKVTGKPPINYLIMYVMFVFSLSVMSNPLRLHGLQHARLSCPSPTPGASSTEWVIPSNHLILCRPLLLLPSVLPSFIVFSNELALCIRWPKYWSFSFSISPFNEYSGLISGLTGLISYWFDVCNYFCNNHNNVTSKAWGRKKRMRKQINSKHALKKRNWKGKLKYEKKRKNKVT